MTSAFTFIPRNVAKVKKIKEPGPSTQAEVIRSTSAGTLEVHSDVKGKSRDSYDVEITRKKTSELRTHSLEDYVVLLSLALSDYALWSNPDIRRKIEWNSREVAGGSSKGKEGCKSHFLFIMGGF